MKTLILLFCTVVLLGCEKDFDGLGCFRFHNKAGHTVHVNVTTIQGHEFTGDILMHNQATEWLLPAGKYMLIVSNEDNFKINSWYTEVISIDRNRKWTYTWSRAN